MDTIKTQKIKTLATASTLQRAVCPLPNRDPQEILSTGWKKLEEQKRYTNRLTNGHPEQGYGPAHDTDEEETGPSGPSGPGAGKAVLQRMFGHQRHYKLDNPRDREDDGDLKNHNLGSQEARAAYYRPRITGQLNSLPLDQRIITEPPVMPLYRSSATGEQQQQAAVPYDEYADLGDPATMGDTDDDDEPGSPGLLPAEPESPDGPFAAAAAAANAAAAAAAAAITGNIGTYTWMSSPSVGGQRPSGTGGVRPPSRGDHSPLRAGLASPGLAARRGGAAGPAVSRSTPEGLVPTGAHGWPGHGGAGGGAGPEGGARWNRRCSVGGDAHRTSLTGDMRRASNNGDHGHSQGLPSIGGQGAGAGPAAGPTASGALPKQAKARRSSLLQVQSSGGSFTLPSAGVVGHTSLLGGAPPTPPRPSPGASDKRRSMPGSSFGLGLGHTTTTSSSSAHRTTLPNVPGTPAMEQYSPLLSSRLGHQGSTPAELPSPVVLTTYASGALSPSVNGGGASSGLPAAAPPMRTSLNGGGVGGGSMPAVRSGGGSGVAGVPPPLRTSQSGNASYGMPLGAAGGGGGGSGGGSGGGTQAGASSNSGLLVQLADLRASQPQPQHAHAQPVVAPNAPLVGLDHLSNTGLGEAIWQLRGIREGRRGGAEGGRAKKAAKEEKPPEPGLAGVIPLQLLPVALPPIESWQAGGRSADHLDPVRGLRLVDAPNCVMPRPTAEADLQTRMANHKQQMRDLVRTEGAPLSETEMEAAKLLSRLEKSGARARNYSGMEDEDDDDDAAAAAPLGS